MMEVRHYIAESGLTQADAAKAFETTQPRLHEVLKGKIEKCTLEGTVYITNDALELLADGEAFHEEAFHKEYWCAQPHGFKEEQSGG